MAKTTKIEYCDSTLNLIMGCHGCELFSLDTKKNLCYAADMCRRYAGKRGWPEFFRRHLHSPQRLAPALKWPDLTNTDRDDKPWLNRQPRIIFVNDLGDGFAPGINPMVWLSPKIDVMAASPHVWLLLTKWPEKMLEFFEFLGFVPPNFWLGTSVLQEESLWRAEVLTLIPDANLWLSLEPLLGPVSIAPYLRRRELDTSHPGERIFSNRIQWVAAGGPSGPNASPMPDYWLRTPLEECADAGVPFFFKQWGEFVDYHNAPSAVRLGIDRGEWTDTMFEEHQYFIVGKRNAGRSFNGKTYVGIPDFGG